SGRSGRMSRRRRQASSRLGGVRSLWTEDKRTQQPETAPMLRRPLGRRWCGPYWRCAMSDNKTGSNGRVQRRSLNEEVHRLHDGLDGLAENLEGVVVSAVREAVSGVVRQAVEAAVREVLSNPALLRAAVQAPMPAPKAEAKPKSKPVREVVAEVCGEVR